MPYNKKRREYIINLVSVVSTKCRNTNLRILDVVIKGRSSMEHSFTAINCSIKRTLF